MAPGYITVYNLQGRHIISDLDKLISVGQVGCNKFHQVSAHAKICTFFNRSSSGTVSRDLAKSNYSTVSSSAVSASYKSNTLSRSKKSCSVAKHFLREPFKG